VYIYKVLLSNYSILRLDSSVEEARKWAKKAFPKENAVVRREGSRWFCESCDCSPCVCDEIVTEHPFGPEWVHAKVEENERGFGRKS
jgi:hypothetical protein